MDGRAVVCKACNRRLVWDKDGYVTCPAAHMERYWVHSGLKAEPGQVYQGAIGWLMGTYPIEVPASEVTKDSIHAQLSRQGHSA